MVSKLRELGEMCWRLMPTIVGEITTVLSDRKHTNGAGADKSLSSRWEFLRKTLMAGVCAAGTSVLFILASLVEKDTVLRNCVKDMNL